MNNSQDSGHMLGRSNVLVTGAAGGIGRGIVEAFAATGARVVIADRDNALAEKAAAEIAERFPQAQVVAEYMDVTDVPQTQSAIAAIDREYPLDVVVCNAGVAIQKPTVDMTEQDFDRLFNVNVKGVYFVMQEALRVMLQRGNGSIITISSTSGFTASTGPMSAYDASKAAVRLMTASAAKEAAALGVRVNSVAPGTVQTALTLDLASADALATLGAQRVPMGRLGLPSEIGDACVFLASPQASYITGQTLAVDGGWLA